MLSETPGVVIGVDTHSQTHAAVVIDHLGRRHAIGTFNADPAGYRQLLDWASEYGMVTHAGVEGTGDYGAGLTSYLQAAGVTVIDVNRPDRARRRRHGKNDHVDAENAARAVLSGDATTLPKPRHTILESLRVLRLVRNSAIKARTVALNQIKDLVVAAPEPVRSELHQFTNRQRVTISLTWTHGPLDDPVEATRRALSALAQRIQQLDHEIRELDREINNLATTAAPNLLAHHGVGPETAAQLLITAGANPDRLRTEAAFAALCGVSPVEASSGQTTRHRLNRGGDRQANRALWTIAFVRARRHERTRTYIQHATTNGKNRKETIRSLKRYIARELYPALIKDLTTLT